MTVRMSSKGQLVVPKDIRERLHLKEGQAFRIEEADGTVMIVPVPKNPIQALRGSAKGLIREESTRLIRKEREEWKDQ